MTLDIQNILTINDSNRVIENMKLRNIADA